MGNQWMVPTNPLGHHTREVDLAHMLARCRLAARAVSI